MRSTVLLAIVTALCSTAVTGAGRAAATDGPLHVATGNARLSDGLELTLEAVAGPDLARGSAWLSSEEGELVRVALDCVIVEFHDTPYPIYPWLPYNSLHTSGRTDDGTRYFLTVHDQGPAGAGRRDLAAVAPGAGDGACGSPSTSQPLADGDITVAG
jgi:hypothetical protein